MSSLVRRIQRMQKRKSLGAMKRSINDHFGDRLGMKNKKAADLLARQKRESSPALKS